MALPLLIPIAAGVAKAGLGFLQQAKGKKMLKSAIDPGYKIPKGFGQNLGQAEQLAKVGMPAEQYNLARQNMLRNVGTATRQLGRSSNPSAGLASLLRGQNDASLSLDVANAQARRQNIMQAMAARREMAGQQLAQQQYAQNRYFDKVNEANARIGAGTQNIFGGLSDIGTAGIMNMAAKGNPNLNQGGQQIAQTPYVGNFGSPAQVGQYGTRLSGSQLGGIGSNYNYPMTPFMPKMTSKFTPKTLSQSMEGLYNLD